MKYSTQFSSLEHHTISNHDTHCTLLKNRVPVSELYTEELVTGTNIKYCIVIF